MPKLEIILTKKNLMDLTIVQSKNCVLEDLISIMIGEVVESCHVYDDGVYIGPQQ